MSTIPAKPATKQVVKKAVRKAIPQAASGPVPARAAPASGSASAAGQPDLTVAVPAGPAAGGRMRQPVKSESGRPKAKAPNVAAKPVKPAKVAKPAKGEKARKPKLVRDSFTIPKAEYSVLELLKQRAILLGASIKKSELLRAGIKALAAMGDAHYLAALAAVPAIKTGRPAKS